MHKLHILDRNGDTTLEWDPQLEGAVNEALSEAKEKFAEHKELGYLAYRTDADGSNAETVNTFDESAPVVVLSPQLVGG